MVFSNMLFGVFGGWGYFGGLVNVNSGVGVIQLYVGYLDNLLFIVVCLCYSVWDVGLCVIDNINEFNCFLVGVKGNWGDWSYDIVYLYFGIDLVNKCMGFLCYDVVCCVLGNLVCFYGIWCIGDNVLQMLQLVYDVISLIISVCVKLSLDMFDFIILCSLMDFKGGLLGLVFGMEWCKMSNSLMLQIFIDIGQIIGLGYLVYDGMQNVYVGYVELFVLVLEQLELSVVVCYDKYESGEGKVMLKLGVKWILVDWIVLCVSYVEGFCVLNLVENGDGGLVVFFNVCDLVCCVIDLVNECIVCLVVIIMWLNKDLKLEEFKSYLVGIVLQLILIILLIVDVWEIKCINEIVQGSMVDVIVVGNVFCDVNNIGGVVNSGIILVVNIVYVNVNFLCVRGIDIDICQIFDIGLGQLEMDLQWSYVFKFECIEGDIIVDYVGIYGNCDVINCIGMLKDCINFGIIWKQGLWSISGVVNYISKLENKDCCGGDYLVFYEDGELVEKIFLFIIFDLFGCWNIIEVFELNVLVQNVFDCIVLFDLSIYGVVNYNLLYFSGVIGWYFIVGVKYMFK